MCGRKNSLEVNTATVIVHNQHNARVPSGTAVLLRRNGRSALDNAYGWVALTMQRARCNTIVLVRSENFGY